MSCGCATAPSTGGTAVLALPIQGMLPGAPRLDVRGVDTALAPVVPYPPATAAGQVTAQAEQTSGQPPMGGKPKSTAGTWVVLGVLAAGLALFA